MRVVSLTSFVAVLLLGIAGCGGDNLELCDGCGASATPTPTTTVTPSATPTVATSTSASTSPVPIATP